MKPETEQLLGTLEVLTHQPFLWKTEPQGEFNIWNLMISEGFVSLTDSELAFEHWQNIERWGTPTQQVLGYEYAPSRFERKDDWNEAIATQRQEHYQQLQHLFSKLQNIQAYSLSIPNFYRKSFEWTHPDFWVSILVGETCDRQWVCLAPTVPDQLGFHYYYYKSKEVASLSDPNQALPSPISSILDKLNPISIYGYYHGGYNHTYLHQIVGAIAKTKISAIEIALQAAQMVSREKPKVNYADNGDNSRKLNQFMNQCLRDRTRYSISFWDISYTYELGQAVTGDWLGISSTTEFEYNP